MSNQLASLRGLTATGNHLNGVLNDRGVETIKDGVVTTKTGEATNETISEDNRATGNRVLCIPTNVIAVIAAHLYTQCSIVRWKHHLNMERSCRINSSQKAKWGPPALF